MKRLAFITDLHADAQSLRDALRRISKIGCDPIICGGDLVDIGQYPEETITVIRDHKIPCIRGNHDRWVLEQIRVPVSRQNEAEKWIPSKEAITFLEALALSWSATIEGVRIAIHHGTPYSDMDGIYPDQVTGSDVRRWLDKAEADALLVGHTHIPFILSIPGRGIVANPGAILREIPIGEILIYNPLSQSFLPGADTVEGGTFGVLELPSLLFTVHRAADGTEIEIVRKTVF
jgi:predicted phosphodiesterase